MRDVLTLHLAPDPVEPVDVEMAPRTLATCPWLTFAISCRYVDITRNLFYEIGFQWSQFSTMATAMSFVIDFCGQKIKLGSPVELCLISHSELAS